MSLIGNIFSSLQAGDSAASGVVGIDIGSSSIKVVELQERNDVITLTTYGEVQLGPYVGKEVGQSATLEAKQEQEALVDVIRESAVKARSAVFAMPLSSSFVTNVNIETDPDSDLAAMVRVEARKVIPASLSEVTLDWAEVEFGKKDAKKNSNRHDVLIAAIQNAALERFKVLMQFIGIKQTPTEIECFSAIRGLYDSEEPDLAIIDLGATSAKLYLAQKGLLMRMYRIRAGGAIATKEIANKLNVDFETAEQMKFAADKSAANFGDIKRVHHGSYDRAFREFNQVLREYEQRAEVKFDTVFLTGGGALFPGIDAHLKDALDREVIMAHPFSKVAYPAFMQDTMKQIGPSFTVALGAAMRSFE
ncbi:type IV pilus assembly protein PilM [Candidatus Kaiserbacteria bacterium]|nr:type IV pilus assembly protein PilM [Candidatus Kaiserbacteria bacterium]MCB9812177.1 type IV pilus assembly protein PilM [Candidatus Nomurabacteria bacterium]